MSNTLSNQSLSFISSVKELLFISSLTAHWPMTYLSNTCDATPSAWNSFIWKLSGQLTMTPSFLSIAQATDVDCFINKELLFVDKSSHWNWMLILLLTRISDVLQLPAVLCPASCFLQSPPHYMDLNYHGVGNWFLVPGICDMWYRWMMSFLQASGFLMNKSLLKRNLDSIYYELT